MRTYHLLRTWLLLTSAFLTVGLCVSAVYPPVTLPFTKNPEKPPVGWSTQERGVIEIHLDRAKDPITGSPAREIRIYAHPSQQKNVKVTYVAPDGR
jgi:hypothetical protein